MLKIIAIHKRRTKLLLFLHICKYLNVFIKKKPPLQATFLIMML